MCGLLFNTLRYQGLAWERKRRDPRLHAVVCRLGYQQVSPRTISPGSACRSKADASTTQLQASKANVWAILLELKLLEPNSSESRFFFFRNPFRNASIYIYIYYFDLALLHAWKISRGRQRACKSLLLLFRTPAQGWGILLDHCGTLMTFSVMGARGYIH